MSEWSQVEVEIHVVAPRENAASRYGKTASREQVSVPGGGRGEEGEEGGEQ